MRTMWSYYRTRGKNKKLATAWQDFDQSKLHIEVAFQDQSRSVMSVYMDNMAADYMDSANLKHLSLF